MIHHISIGVRDLALSGGFYDAAFGALGLRRVFEDDTAIGYGLVDDEDKFCLKLAPLASAPGPGTHFAFPAASRAEVDAFHRAALEVAGRCNGAPGVRPDYGPHYYAAFLIDPDGHRIEAVCKTRLQADAADGVLGENGLDEVSLREVTEENFEDFIVMELPEHQRDLLASNAFSIAQTRFYPDYIARAIYLGARPAGLLLYDRKAGDLPGHYGIYRFMVEHALQGQGIGRRALELLLAELRGYPDARRITICYHPRNAPAKAFYARLGFVEAGLDEQGEMIAEIDCAPTGPL